MSFESDFSVWVIEALCYVLLLLKFFGILTWSWWCTFLPLVALLGILVSLLAGLKVLELLDK